MRLLVVFLAIFAHSHTHASRGWYMSIAGLSSKQDHTVSEYSSTAEVQSITQQYSTTSALIINQEYDFTQTTSTQSGYVAYTELNNAATGNYINTSQIFYLATNDPSRTITPVINTQPIGTSSSKTITDTAKRHIIATVTYTGSNGLYKVSLSPINWDVPSSDIQLQVQSELNATNIVNSTQLQSFLESFQKDRTAGVELSIGYKFRPFQSSWFVAPQVDFTSFGTKTKQTAYGNSTLTSFSQAQDNTHATAITRDTFDSSTAFSMVGKVGYENSVLLGLAKIPFSIYGVIGGTSAMRKYRDVQTNNFGAKYGIGGEIFLSKKLALFAEFYQIQFFEQNVDYQSTQKYTNSTEVQGILNNSANAATTVTIANDSSSATTGYKTTTYQYSSLAQSIGDIKYDVNEAFKIQSKTSAFKVGLTYYF